MREKQRYIYIYGTCIPFNREKIVPGHIQSLPTYFIYEGKSLVRKPKEIKPYILVNEPYLYDEKLWINKTLIKNLQHKNLAFIDGNIGLYWYEKT